MNQELEFPLNEFFSQIKLSAASTSRDFEVSELKKDLTLLDEFEAVPGVHLFTQHGVMKYVGRALSSGLKSRIKDRIKNRTSSPNGWHIFIQDEQVMCKLIIFPRSDWFFAVALEVLLISKFNPRFNRRVG